ncbi:VCBS domain-containing protein [Pseudoroseomonas cervicalis]|uniref:VCBS repeat (3 repeats) n=1 Tax=Pseudoroseomonas cervicalis ATCC 49957 TaxID=525371 RepID=D5RHW9_9PROT|nr:VCBS domain-containing protein [Pseudoroseomonas cervicalis]EFH13102.1 VCBS repeat (3 repeats) [Pseudoroseomonas cervicalis ATCC 49957]
MFYDVTREKRLGFSFYDINNGRFEADPAISVGFSYGVLTFFIGRSGVLTYAPEAVSIAGLPLDTGTPLIADLAYQLANTDVLAAGISAEAHYAQFGWREGRATGSLFDGAYYLRVNQDVREAGINPVEHYLNFGWREGRDPNPLFDTSFYLAQNADVAEAGINPLEHYLLWGRHEARDANPFFDAGFYLQQHPELVEIGADPLAHYSEQGWREGIAASRGFITKVYLAQNPDVAAAGIDPLRHYLEYGQAEGRAVSSGTPASITGRLTASTDEDSGATLTGRITVLDVDPLESGMDATFGGRTVHVLADGRETYGEPVIDTTGGPGRLRLSPDGSWSYTADSAFYQYLREGEVLEERFTLRTIGQDEVVVSITILGRNDPAVFMGETHGVVHEAAGPGVSGSVVYMWDPDRGESSLRAGLYEGLYGRLELTAQGAWDYLFTGNAGLGITPGEAHAELTDAITIRSLDGTPHTVSIDILAFGGADALF